MLDSIILSVRYVRVWGRNYFGSFPQFRSTRFPRPEQPSEQC